MRDPQAHTPLRHGAQVTDRGVEYHWWSPETERAAVMVREQGDKFRRVELKSDVDGWFSGFDPRGQAGDLFQIALDENIAMPDVASRFQPEGVRGPSQVIDPKTFLWSDQQWKRPRLEDLVIYELHVGTFTEAGTFTAAIERLDYLCDLGVNALELMPISAFPGDRNWGYDVVLHFGPANVYGTPDDLRRWIDAAHQHGLAVIIDVVYNHVCGEPNLLKTTSAHYFHGERGNAWGSSLNFDGKHSTGVRAFFLQNAISWFDEFHADGLRLDATHAIEDSSPVHILKEIADAAHARGGFVIAEDERNNAKLIRPANENGCGLDAVWADDFHHVIKMALRPEPIGYFQNFQGTPDELRDTLENGWLFRGQIYPQKKKPRGTECRDCPPEKFVHCISNHDQAGNRPLGERLNQLVSPQAYRAASMLLLLSPYTPMIFMGQEFAATAPFIFFCNHGGSFGAKVNQGRLKEFADFGSDWPAEMLAAMPDPEEFDAFQRSKLNWAERDESPQREILALYRECLQLRAGDPILRRRSRDQWKVWLDGETLFLRYGLDDAPSRMLISHLARRKESILAATLKPGWKIIFSSNDRRFGGVDSAGLSAAESQVRFRGPETIFLGKDL